MEGIWGNRFMVKAGIVKGSCRSRGGIGRRVTDIHQQTFPSNVGGLLVDRFIRDYACSIADFVA